MTGPVPGLALRASRAAAIAGLVGFACMAVELTAVRLLAPYFGDSAFVWTNVIGVLLLALALGAWVGGRLAEREPGGPIRRLLLGASVLVAVAPLLARPLGGWLLPQELPLDAAMPALVRGSLAASALLFAPPVFLLGAIAPLLVVAAVRAGTPVGRAAGSVSAAGTLGSLLGTFAATHWLVPGHGCRATMWVCAVLLAAAALLVRRAPLAPAVVLLLVGGSMLGHLGPLRSPASGTELLAERESRYQYLQVVRTPDAQAGGRTELKINEGLDSFHSVAIDGRVFTAGSYYDYHALVPLLAGDGQRPPGLHALSIGDAAGTFRRIYDAVHPGATVDAVEIDPAAVELGAQWFGGRRAPGQLVTDLDGRVFVDRAAAQWHAIHVDAYSHQVHIPAHLASREFFASARRRLLPGGVIACNVGGLRPDDPVLVAIAQTLAAEFGEAQALHVPRSRNYLLVARLGRSIEPAALAGFAPGNERLGEIDREAWSAVLAVARQGGAWTRYAPCPDGTALVDDRPELDRLLYRSYVGIDDWPEPTRMAGAQSAESAEGAAFAARQRGDPTGVLAAASASRTPTAYLHYLCGGARWELRQLHGAAADYRAGLQLAGTSDLVPQLRAELDSLEVELGPHELAAATSRRNGWLAVSALVVGVLAAGWCGRGRVGRGG